MSCYYIISVMRVIVPFLLVIHASLCPAAVSSQSQGLEDLREKIVTAPSQAFELAYLKQFPSSFAEFRRIFYGSDLDELYPTYELHLNLLWQLASRYPDRVLKIQTGIAVGGKWDADAIGMLQQQLVHLAKIQPARFANAMMAHTAGERKSIVTFLADVENRSAYVEYQSAIEGLKKLGYKTLAKEFEIARDSRERKRDH